MDQPDAWVIDSSALIAVKRAVAASDQWPTFRKLETMVEAGQLYFPRQVTTELEQARYVDTPEAWGLALGPRVVRCYEPAAQHIRTVMALAGDVVDVDAEADAADPYVLAQALELTQAGLDTCIVTEDSVDRMPLKISMVTACARLSLRSCRLDAFLAAI